jgi:16S rRNA (cytosine967-C5)-methyltransferase
VPGAYFLKGREQKQPGESILPLRIQDEASQLIPHLMGEVNGWSIWDACAAPGGKSAILCENAGETGFVVSSDLSWQRCKRLAHTLSECGSAKSRVLVLDARKAPPLRKAFDAVIADVPCSGLGTLRRNPDIKWRFTPEQLLALRSSQEQFLDSVSDAVRRGGYLLYSTCSTEPEENEEVVFAFLGRHPEFKIMRPSHPPGIEALLDERGLVRTFPGIRLWDGFFAALMLHDS